MSLKAKYQPVLDMGVELGVTEGGVEETPEGKLKVWGTAKTEHEKNVMWNKIKEIGGNEPGDIEADIQVANTDHYHVHTVSPGDTLGKIAATYYGKAKHYMHIFNANTDQLTDPNMIKVGQEIVIPHIQEPA